MKTNTACIGFHYLYYSAGVGSGVTAAGVGIWTVIFVVSDDFALLAARIAGSPYTMNKTTATATIIIPRRNPNPELSPFPGEFTIVVIRY
jgi:hypothetical protein